MSTNFSINNSQASAVMGYFDGLAKEIETSQYLTAAINYTYTYLNKEFGEAADAAARLAPDAFSHVYEWGREYGDISTVGNPNFRLWKMVSTGQGSKKVATFVLGPSIRPVPVAPVLLEPGPTGKSVKPEIHVFTWKARVMEYGIPVTVRPKLPGVKAVAFVGSDGEPKFRTGPFSFVPGRSHKGVFTSYFFAWWNVEAGQIFDRMLKPKLEADVVTDAKLDGVRRKFTTRTKTVKIEAKNEGGEASFKAARKIAIAEMKKNQKDYIRNAAKRRLDLYGD